MISTADYDIVLDKGPSLKQHCHKTKVSNDSLMESQVLTCVTPAD